MIRVRASIRELDSREAESPHLSCLGDREAKEVCAAIRDRRNKSNIISSLRILW